MLTKHIVVDITGHGFGHMAQTIEVLDALNQHYPNLRFTLRSQLKATSIYQRLQCTSISTKQVNLMKGGFDIGLHMFDAITVDSKRSLQAYQQLHQYWPAKVKQQSEQLRRLDADLLVANISYLSLAAAKQIDLPAIALCSLDWASIFQQYCGDQPEADAIYTDMLAAYNAADLFLQLQPHLPMSTLTNRASIAPIARAGKAQHNRLRQQLGLNKNSKIGIISMGGIPTKINWQQWPVIEDIHWLSNANISQRQDVTIINTIDMDFSDIAASSDLIISKTGYGLIVEAALAQVPLLYIERPDWPEEPYLSAWSKAHNRTLTLQRQQINDGAVIKDKISTLLNMPAVTNPVITGEQQAVAYIGNFL